MTRHSRPVPPTWPTVALLVVVLVGGVSLYTFPAPASTLPTETPLIASTGPSAAAAPRSH